MFSTQIRISFLIISSLFIAFIVVIILTSRKAFQPQTLRSIGFKTRKLLPQRFGYFIIKGNDYYHKYLYLVDQGKLKKVDTRYHSAFNNYGLAHYSKVAHTAANGTMHIYPATVLNQPSQIDSFILHAPFVFNRLFSGMKMFQDRYVVMLCSRPTASLNDQLHYPIKAFKFYVPADPK